MTNNFKNWWHHNGIWVIIFGSILLFLILWIIRYFFSEEFDDNVPILDYLFYGSTRHSKNKSVKTGKRKIIKESKGELLCRDVVTKIFNKPFIKIRPNILRNNKTGKNLELDIYNDELKLAIEYNGRQHYEYIPYLHRDYQAFLDQKYRDDLKRKLCKENNIILIEVPYTIKFDDIESFLKNKISEFNIKT
jgi:hypothetical protein